MNISEKANDLIADFSRALEREILSIGTNDSMFNLYRYAREDLEDYIAELEANNERLKACESALISMVNQFFHREDNILYHSFMSAEEEASEYLVEHGIARWADENKNSICFNYETTIEEN